MGIEKEQLLYPKNKVCWYCGSIYEFVLYAGGPVVHCNSCGGYDIPHIEDCATDLVAGGYNIEAFNSYEDYLKYLLKED